jgi:hemoglobin-like flavoprotein
MAQMDAQTIQLVQDSWEKVLPISGVAGPLFYKNLFEADPSLRSLFKGNMPDQAAKLMQMIGAAVGLLTDLDKLIPVLKQLGARHTGYGVVTAHYSTVGGALLSTLQQGLGPAFTPEVKEAWASAYSVITEVMTSPA